MPGGQNTWTLVTGATTSTLTVRPAVGERSYRVIVSSSCGSVDSAVATVSVCQLPVITVQPRSTNIKVGETTTLVVETSHATAFQWYAGEPGDTTAELSGATMSSLSVSPTDTTTYWVRVRNECGAVSSTGAIVAVCHPPSITTPPQSATITAGQTTTLLVEGTNATSYQWYSAANNQAAAPITDETNASITVAPMTSTHYWVVVTGPCGTAMAQGALITVLSCTPTIIVSPADQNIAEGDDVTLQVVARIESDTLSYQWYETPAGLDAWTAVPGATSDTLTIRPATGETWYRVTVSSSCGSITSQIAAVTTVANCESPTITQDLPPEVHIEYNQATTLAITASGTAPLAYQWYELQLYFGILRWHELPGATNPTVSVIGSAEGALYRVEVSNDCGITSSSTVKVIGDKDPVFDSIVATYHVTQSGTRLLDDTIVTFTDQTQRTPPKRRPRQSRHQATIG